MPSKPHVRRRRARQAEIREKILDAARSIFALEGHDAVTMRAIGERSEYTPSAIYKHFPNKDAILAELRHDAMSRLALAMTEGIERVTQRLGGPLAALREAARSYLGYATAEPQAYALAFGSPLQRSGLGSVPVVEAFAELIARSRREAEVEINPFDRDRATVLWHALHGRALAPRDDGQDDSRFVDLCLASFQLGLPNEGVVADSYEGG